MADQKPVTPSAQKPTAGVVPRPAPGRAGNSGPLRPGATPANSPAAIPAVLRGPVAPLSPGWQAAVAGAGPAVPQPGAAHTDLREAAGTVEQRGATPTDLREAPGTVEQRGAAKLQQRHSNAGVDVDRDRPRPGTRAGTTRTASPDPGAEQRRKIARNAGSGSGPDKPRGGRVHSAQGTATVPKPPAPGLLFRPIVRVTDLAAAITFYEHLGAEVVHGGPEADYVLVQLGTVQVGLIAHPGWAGPGAVELNFSAALPLDELERQLRGRGVTVARSMHNTAFGPQLHVCAPDGLLIKIGQLEPDDYL